MGKVKHRRLQISRYAPTKLHNSVRTKDGSSNVLNENGAGNFISTLNHAVESGKSMENGVSQNNLGCNKGGLNNAMEKVSSELSDEKITGLNMLAAFALESKGAESIIESKMIGPIAVLLQDKCCQVRLAAAGTLRNLCSWGADEVIDMIVQQDIMHPLSQLLKTYENNIPPGEGAKRKSSLTYHKGVATTIEDSDPNDLIFIHTVNVLWSLCECSEEALLAFNQDNLVNILLKHINPFAWSYSISLAAADCLLCVSENNPKISSAILPLAETLMALVVKSFRENCDAFGLHYAVLILGILLNINFLTPGNATFNHLFEVLNKLIEADATSFMEPIQSEKGSKSLLQERFEHVISSQMVAFEILSNICCSDDDDDDIQEYEESCDDAEVMMEDEPMDLEGGMQKDSDTVPVEVLEGIKYFQLIHKTQKKVMEQPIRHTKSESDNQNIVEKLGQLHIRALQCFQNLVNCLPLEDLGGSEDMYSTWLHLGQNSFCHSQNADPNLLEAVSGAMRAIVEKLSQNNFDQFVSISTVDLQPIFGSLTSCEVHSVRTNFCRMVGTLGCSIIKHSTEDSFNSADIENLLTSITEVLLKVAQGDDCLWVRAEAIDVLIDLFSDDKTDKLATSIRLVERLKEIHPQFKAKFNQQKKKLGDHRPLVLTVKDNLASFIKYKGLRTLKCSKMIV